MKIKYLKDTHDSRIGDVKEIPEVPANVLIQLGIAEVFSDFKQSEAARLAKAEAERLTAEKEYGQIPPGVLLNLSGRPVVDDLGSMVEQPKPPQETKKPEKEGSKSSK